MLLIQTGAEKIFFEIFDQLAVESVEAVVSLQPVCAVFGLRFPDVILLVYLSPVTFYHLKSGSP